MLYRLVIFMDGSACGFDNICFTEEKRVKQTRLSPANASKFLIHNWKVAFERDTAAASHFIPEQQIGLP